MFAPGRLFIHERGLSALDLLAVLESSIKYVPQQAPASQDAKKQQQIQQQQHAIQQQQQQATQPQTLGTIDFAKLFDEK